MDSVEGKLEPVGHAEFVENVVQMIFDRLLADEKFLADFAVAKTLVLPEGGDGSMDVPEKTIVRDSDVFRRLALVARYDRSAAREMYRTMSLLLIMRSEGETGLENWVRATAGIKNEIGKDNKNG